MDLRRYEPATVAAAGALRSSCCTPAHGRMLAEQVMGSEGVIQFLTDRESAPLDAVVGGSLGPSALSRPELRAP